MSSAAEIAAYWNSRASLGETAGTQDLLLKQLEQRAILGQIKRPIARVLEIGCGRGELIGLLALQMPFANLWAIDTSENMIDAAIDSVSGVTFTCGDIYSVPKGILFDLIYTERCLINLQTWPEQKATIDEISTRLVPGGRFLMCEHSQDGLDALNDERERFGLPRMDPPFHNRYFRDAELATIDSLRLLECQHFSARYYYHSRVINAWLAQQAGRPTDYQAPVNQMALQTDAPFHFAGAQGRLWVWEKA